MENKHVIIECLFHLIKQVMQVQGDTNLTGQLDYVGTI
jgi:hypothetical protein